MKKENEINEDTLFPIREENNLSEKRICVGDVKLGTLNSDLPYYVYPEERVKEFIEIDTELINQFACGDITLPELKQRREKLAGAKLT